MSYTAKHTEMNKRTSILNPKGGLWVMIVDVKEL